VRELEDCCGSVVVSFWHEKLVAEARDSLGTQEDGKCPPLEAATEEQLVKT
jgi:hypothetical protein